MAEERPDPLVLAVNRFADLLERRWTELRNVLVIQAVAIFAILIGLWVTWGVASDTNDIASRLEDTQISSACSSASARKFPRFLEDNAELTKALAWSAECNRMNGVEELPIKLPK